VTNLPEPSRQEGATTPAEVRGRESNAGYVAFHAPRFAFLLDLLGHHLRGERHRVLDVGPSNLTPELARRFGGKVDSLGLEPEEDLPDGHHFHFDLNDAQERTRWRTDLGPYDVIVFAEVIEHLHTAPELAVSYLRTLLAPQGLLLIQTPNAASLRKRVKLLLGQNPFERIRLDPTNPGHFREYTAAEIEEIVTGAGLTIVGSWNKFYFDARRARHSTGLEPPQRFIGAAKNALYRILPPSLREGVAVLARNR
jgi:SAM-dependent methyltransferase